MGNEFQPDTITITAGTTVTWIHQDSEAHTVTSDDDLFDKGLNIPGDSFSYTFTEPGVYNYHCVPHEDVDMRGNVIVE